jgi:ABC-type Fe3+ transport system substrate-binding protein
MAMQRTLSRLGFILLAVVTASLPAHAADRALVDAATREGRVVWYTTYIVNQSVGPMIAGFEKRYPGIKVDFVRQGSAELVLRLNNETQAGKVQADVFDGNSTFLPLKKAGMVARWRPDAALSFPPQFVDKEGFWTATTISYLGAMINTEKISASDFPKSYADLLDPKFAGRMVWSTIPDLAAADGFIGNILMTMGRDKGMSYLKELAKQRITGLRASSRQVVNQVISGEYSLALQALAQQQTIGAAAGAPIAWAPLSPALSALNVVGLIKGGPHPNAGKLLVDYILSPEGQGIFATPGYIVPSPDVRIGNPSLTPAGGHFTTNILPPDFDIAQIAQWQGVFNDLFR